MIIYDTLNEENIIHADIDGLLSYDPDPKVVNTGAHRSRNVTYTREDDEKPETLPCPQDRSSHPGFSASVLDAIWSGGDCSKLETCPVQQSRDRLTLADRCPQGRQASWDQIF